MGRKLLLMSDIHLREKQPISRKDAFIEKTQWRKLEWIRALCLQEDISATLHAGDVFDTSIVAPWVLARAYEKLPSVFYTLYGNHDLYRHSLELKEMTSLNVLAKSGRVHIWEKGHWGEEIGEHMVINYLGVRILMVHTMVTEKGVPFFKSYTPDDLFTMFPDVDLFITGHNHKTFMKRKGRQILVNPGALYRTRIDDIDNIPTVYVYDVEKKDIVRVIHVPIEQDVFTDAHIVEQAQRMERIEKFVSELNDHVDLGLDFDTNLEHYLHTNNIEKQVITTIDKIYEQD